MGGLPPSMTPGSGRAGALSGTSQGAERDEIRQAETCLGCVDGRAMAFSNRGYMKHHPMGLYETS